MEMGQAREYLTLQDGNVKTQKKPLGWLGMVTVCIINGQMYIMCVCIYGMVTSMSMSMSIYVCS